MTPRSVLAMGDDVPGINLSSLAVDFCEHAKHVQDSDKENKDNESDAEKELLDRQG